MRISGRKIALKIGAAVVLYLPLDSLGSAILSEQAQQDLSLKT